MNTKWVSNKVGVGATAIVLILSFVGLTLTHQDEYSMLDKALEAVKTVYGDYYIPSKSISAEKLSEIYGISMDGVTDYIGESSLMKTNVDVFIGIKAKRGSVKQIQVELLNYRESLILNSMADPSRLAKARASSVVVIGDYVFFMALGQYMDFASLTNEENASMALTETDKAIEAIHGVFNSKI